MAVAREASQLTPRIRKSPECSVAAAATKDYRSVACLLAIKQVGLRYDSEVDAEATEQSQPITTYSARTHKPPKIDIRQIKAQTSSVGDEGVVVEGRTPSADSPTSEGQIAEGDQMMAESWMGVAQQLSSLSAGFKTPVAYQSKIDVLFEKTIFNPESTPAGPEKTTSLLALTDGTALGLSSPSNVNALSPFQQWLYQNSNERMSTAERLEKSKWETRPLKRL